MTTNGTIARASAGRVSPSGGWRWTTLGEVTEGPGQYGTSQKASRTPPGAVVLRMGNLRDGRITWDDLKYVALPKEEERKYRLSTGDILFNRTNSAELVGKSAVFDGDRDAVFASYLIRFRARRELADPEYLCAYINSQIGRAFIVANMARAIGQVNISASTMSRMPIPLPALEEQRRIAAKLRQQTELGDQLVAAASKQLAAARALEAALIHRVFVEQLRDDDAAPLRPVRDFVRAIGGGTPSKQNAAFWRGTIPWVSPKDMKVFDIHDAQDHVSREAVAASATNLIDPGAVLIVVRGMILAR